MSRSSRMLLMFASALTFIAFFANFCVVAAPHLPGPKVMRQSQVSRPTPPPVRPEPQPGVPQGGPTSGADVSMAFTAGRPAAGRIENEAGDCQHPFQGRRTRATASHSAAPTRH